MEEGQRSCKTLCIVSYGVSGWRKASRETGTASSRSFRLAPGGIIRQELGETELNGEALKAKSPRLPQVTHLVRIQAGSPRSQRPPPTDRRAQRKHGEAWRLAIARADYAQQDKHPEEDWQDPPSQANYPAPVLATCRGNSKNYRSEKDSEGAGAPVTQGARSSRRRA